MNIVANNVASKLFVAFVAVAMLFMLVSPAKAATTDELQAQITALLAQIAALQGQVGQGGQSVASGVCPFTWTRTLSQGSTGADVMKLQQSLNADADTRVSASGVGSVGMETEYYGPATAAAVSKFQVKYRSEVLSPSGLVNPTGMFGPASMAKMNAICNVPGTTEDDASDDTSDDSDDSDDTASGDLSGEASLKSFDIEDGDDVELEEGQTADSVQEFVVEFEDGDAMITRLDVELDTDSTDDAWDVFGDVTLFVDGDAVKTIDGSDKDNYRDDDMTLRFSGLDVVAMEDEETTVTLGVEVQDNLDDNSHVVTVDVTSMRFVDADEVTTTEDPDATANTFDISAAGSEDELIVKSSTEDPAAATLVVKNDSVKSDWYTVFAFDLDTDDSTNDIELNDIAVRLDTGAADVDMVVQDAELVIDGVTFDDWDWSSSTDDDNSRDMTFNVDGDAVLDAGDRVTTELKLRFFGNNAGSQYAEGETIQASASTSLFDVEGVESVDASGSATGDEHSLRSSGVAVTEFDGSSSVNNNDTTPDSSDASFVFEFSVEAIGDDEIYIPLNAASSSAALASQKGANYRIEDSNGNEITGADSLSAIFQYVSGDGDTDTAGYLHLNSGDVATVKLSVTFNPSSAAGYYTGILDSVNFKMNTAGVADQATALTPESDYDETTGSSVQS